jgi:hypothetical protein
LARADLCVCHPSEHHESIARVAIGLGRTWAKGEEVTMRQITTAQYGVIISTVAIFISCGSLYLSKLSFDLSSAKDQRELMDKMPAIDVQLNPAGVSNAAMMIVITNRADINVAPLDITVEHSFEIGDLYLSSAQQSIDLLKSSLSLSPIGTIAPKGVGKLKASVSGVTDGKYNSFTPGLEMQFAVRIRFADDQDTIKTFTFTRRILPPLAAEPCPPAWTLAPRPSGC